MYGNVKHRFTACSTVKTPMEQPFHKAPTLGAKAPKVAKRNDKTRWVFVGNRY